MKVAIFGREVSQEFVPVMQRLIRLLEEKSSGIMIYDDFFQQISGHIHFSTTPPLFHSHEQLPPDTRCLISIGGDGTLLDTITLIRDSGIPILGINTGRLGFLSAVAVNEIEGVMEALFSENYSIDKRSLIQLNAPEALFGEVNFALNELTVLKRDNSSMITINAYVNDLYLNTYWADGLIVATPTGSTGYSLSCGGPIISPDSNTLVITPIATHNLTVRPIIINDQSKVKLKISGRTQDYLVILDSRSMPLSTSVELLITRASFHVNLICVGQKDFYKTIRNKLGWGLDKRN
jgi:NAD+ kinase